MGFRRNKNEAPKQESKSTASGSTSRTSSSKQDKGGKGKPKSVKLGAIVESKEGNLYLSVQREGDYAVELTVNGRPVKGIFTKTPEENLQSLVDNGVIEQDEMDERLAKIPDYVIAEVSVSFDD